MKVKRMDEDRNARSERLDGGNKMDKEILDVTCGARMMWFDKNNPSVLFTDRREMARRCIWESKKDGRKRFLEVRPDKIVDFRKMDFQDKSFKLIVFDPPHVKHAGKTSWLFAEYGCLDKSWQDDLSEGFRECWRVLEDFGVLIFKWNETEIKLTAVLELFEHKPLFGHTTSKHGKTKWMTFMKIPDNATDTPQ
jgi:hypothetical protein